jgi:nucleotidyltransferase/DNA polymerase involved in DNA repair
VDLDAFYVSVERRRDPTLVGRPVIVGGPASGRGVVCSASYEARASGVRSAMPMARAVSLCPRAVVLAPDFPAYEAASEEVFAILRRAAPTLERVSIDEAYLDFTGASAADVAPAPVRTGHRPAGELATPPSDARLGWLDAAARLRARLLADTGLSVSIGIGTSKCVAKVAAGLAKPGGVLEVAAGHEATFLGALPVEALPGVGPKTRERLASLRIHTIGDLARVPGRELETSLGVAGGALVRRARGLDDEPVDGGPRTPRSISRETTFPHDTIDPRVVATTLGALARSAAATLRDERLRARAVVVKWRDAEFRTHTARARLPNASNRDPDLVDAVEALERRRHDPRRRIRLVGVALVDLVPAGPSQLDWFDAFRGASVP